jgi:hypothetical protein
VTILAATYERPLREDAPVEVPLRYVSPELNSPGRAPEPVPCGDGVEAVVDEGVVVSVAAFIWPSTSFVLSLAVSVTDDAVDLAVSAKDRASSRKLVVLPVEPYSFQLFWRRRDSRAPTAPAATPAIIRPPTIIGHRLAILDSFFFPVARRATLFARRALSRAVLLVLSIVLSNLGSSRPRIESSRGAINPAAVPAAWAAARRR